MSQALASPPLGRADGSPDDRTTGCVLLPNISWKTYSAILEEVGDSSIRLTYDRGQLEIEVPSRHHELIKSLVRDLVESSLKFLGTDYEPSASTTWRREDRLSGLEADECYHIQHAPQVRGKIELDLTIDPPPDLAIEVDVSSMSLSKMEIYQRLGVSEIWRVRADGECHMVSRQPDGQYIPITSSLAVPLLTPSIIAHYVRLRDQIGHAAAARAFAAEVLKRP